MKPEIRTDYDRSLDTGIFDGLEPLDVIQWQEALYQAGALTDQQRLHVDHYFKYQGVYSLALIASIVGLSEEQYRESLGDIESTIRRAKERTATRNAEQLGRSRQQPQRPAASEAPKQATKAPSSQVLTADNRRYLSEIEKLRKLNTIPQQSLGAISLMECAGLAPSELNKFSSGNETTQRRAVSEYCVRCTVMIDCGRQAVLGGKADAVYGGYTKPALQLIQRQIASSAK